MFFAHKVIRTARLSLIQGNKIVATQGAFRNRFSTRAQVHVVCPREISKAHLEVIPLPVRVACKIQKDDPISNVLKHDSVLAWSPRAQDVWAVSLASNGDLVDRELYVRREENGQIVVGLCGTNNRHSSLKGKVDAFSLIDAKIAHKERLLSGEASNGQEWYNKSLTAKGIDQIPDLVERLIRNEKLKSKATQGSFKEASWRKAPLNLKDHAHYLKLTECLDLSGRGMNAVAKLYAGRRNAGWNEEVWHRALANAAVRTMHERKNGVQVTSQQTLGFLKASLLTWFQKPTGLSLDDLIGRPGHENILTIARKRAPFPRCPVWSKPLCAKAVKPTKHSRKSATP